MTNVQIRDVPDDVLGQLKSRAASRGQSLQGYLRDLLAAHAGVIKNDQIFDRVSRRLQGVPAFDDDAAELIRRGREERDRALGIAE